MLCSAYTVLASLLSLTLDVTNNYSGSFTLHGVPAARYLNSTMNVGSLTIALPQELSLTSFLWNVTDKAGEPMLGENGTFTELNISLADYAYRMTFQLPQSLIFETDWEGVTLHPAIRPWNTSAGQSGPLAIVNEYRHNIYYFDFIIDSVSLNHSIQEQLEIVLPYTWDFLEYEPGLWVEDAVITLTPFDWSSTEVEDKNSTVYQNDFSNSSQGVSPVFVDLSRVDLRDNCTVFNDSIALETYEGLVNCSTCVHPSYEHSVEAQLQLEYVQYGPVLECSSASALGENMLYMAGNEVIFNFTIEHSQWSSENASSVKVEVDVEAHINVLFMDMRIPQADGSVVVISGTSIPTTPISHYDTAGSPIVVMTRAVLRDSLPLDGNTQYVKMTYSWRSESAAEIFERSCYWSYQSKEATIPEGGSYLDVPTVWNVEEEAVAVATVVVPPGTLSDMFMGLDFEYDTALMEVELVESTAVTSHPAVTLSRPSTITYNGKRKRRAISSQTVVFGTITNPASTGGSATVTVTAKFRPSLASIPFLPVSTTAFTNYAGVIIPFGNTTSTTGLPSLTLSKASKLVDSQTITVNITVSHNSTSAAAYNVVLDDTVAGFTIDIASVTLYGITRSPASGTSVKVIGDGSIKLTAEQYNVSSTAIVLTYTASSKGNPHPSEMTHDNAAVLKWRSALTGSVVGTLTGLSCTKRNEIEKESFIYKHGITAAVVVVGFLLGIVLVPLIIVLVVIILKKTKGGFGVSVQPSATDYRAMSKQKGSNDLLLDAGQKLKQGFTSAMVGVDDSIVAVLSLRDKFTTNRELDTLDIQATVEVDKRMEEERIKSMDNVLNSLLISMVKNGDITKHQCEQTVVLLKKSTKELHIKLAAEYSTAMVEFTERQAMHNRKALGNLIDKQRAEKEAQLEKVSEMSEQDKAELVKHVDTQCQIEQDELSYRLKLEQDAEAEKLRKEFSLRKRIQTKEIHQAALNDLKNKTEMPEEQAAWLLKEHARNVSNLEKIHDDELCRQKLVLEEKLAKRRALAELSDIQEKGQSELLNNIAAGQMEILKKAKKQKILTADEARTMSNEIMNELVNYKQSMEADVAKQEAELHKRLSETKKKKLIAKSKEHEREIADFEKDCQQHQEVETTLNPVEVAEKRLALVAKHEIDLASEEIQIDQENATQLTLLRDQMSQTYKGKLLERERKLLNDLSADGMSDEQVEAIMAEHNSSIENIEMRQKQQYQQQDENLKIRLKKRRRDWEKRMQQEQAEKAQLREQEDAVVSQIIDSQITMSADEREKIMREHEKDMIRLENSLTLNKLKQRQILEQKLADRRAKRLQELQVSQAAAVKKVERKHADEDEDDKQTAALELLKSQAEDRLAVLTEEDAETNFDEELEKVKLEMLQQRAIALREQEDRLGSLVAQLQINKAKELTEIDEKQRAINELKANLIDDLSERGVMSEVEAEQCLEQHKAQQHKLTSKLNNERDKQEKMLKKRLADRLGAREKTLMDGYEERLSEALNKAPNKVAAKLRKAAVLHQRAAAIEEFKLRMEKEISQSLEEMRREHSIKKAKLTQELELRFIASLVQQGKLKRAELKDSLKMLFPAKTDKQLETLINTLHDPNETVADEEHDLLGESSASMLRERIARSVSVYQKENLGIIEEEAGAKKSSAD